MKTIKDVEKWLDGHEISSYSVSSNLHVNVNGNVNLRNKIEGDRLPINFEKVSGYFDISSNDLISLEGCPKIVEKDFDCSKNKIESLFGSPNSVGDFNCSHNRIKSLSYTPKEVEGYFDCSNNELLSIEGSPRTIRGYFKCSHNKISSLKGGPKYIQDYFDCSYNKIDTLKDGPITVSKDFSCHVNELRSLDDIAEEIGWDVITDVNLNHIPSSIFDEENKFWKYKGKEVIKHIYKPIVAISNKADIERWLQKHKVNNFKILEDNSVDVKGDVRLSNLLENYKKLPINFNEVDGDFDISDNVLTSLEGSPKKVGGNFSAYKNELTSLKGGPKEVGKNFVILKNNIRSLEHSPSIVNEDYICSHNPLTNLEGLINVGGSVFTGVYIGTLKYIEFSYHSIITYKYTGTTIMEYLDKEYVTLTEEEKIYNKTRENLKSAITNMLNEKKLKVEMINDNLLKNLTKYNLVELKKRVLELKNPTHEIRKKALTEDEIMKSVFNTEI
ncbi:MAG: hypothetical protein C0625_10790 [Arcobacter sp.]|nr:MAG: hypothetical protein C0625_10790 [Arcobacter sp.]